MYMLKQVGYKSEELHVAILLLEREDSFCGTTACNDSLGDVYVSSILAMPSIIDFVLELLMAVVVLAVLLFHASCYSEYIL